MGDLQISAGLLDELRTALRSMTVTLEGACHQVSGVDAGVMGAQPLVDGIQQFTSGWRYGITQVGQHSEQASQMLTHIGKTFDALEGQLAAELRRNGKR
jgi:hypothetical protein